MKTTGLKVAVILLVAILLAGLAFAGWGGGRRGGGWYGPGIERGIQDDTEEQGPWMWPGPGHEGPESEAWQGDPGRGRSRPYDFVPRAGGQRYGRGFDGAGGPGARFGRGGRAGRGFQGADICPYCQGSGRRSVLQRQPMRGNWEQGLRDGRAGGGFRRGAGLPGRGAWGRPGRGLQGGNFGPWGQGSMMERGPWGGNRGQGPRSRGIGRGFQGRDFGSQGPGPMMRRGPMEENRGQVFGPNRGGRGFRRGDAPAPEEQGQGLDRPDRNERPFPGPRGSRGREDRPRLRRGQGGPPEEHPEEKIPDTTTEAPAETDNSKDQPTSDGV